MRHDAVNSLGELGDPKAVDGLIQTLRDEEDSVRWASAEALGKIGDSRAIEPLTMVLNDSHKLVRKNAAKALLVFTDTNTKGTILPDEIGNKAIMEIEQLKKQREQSNKQIKKRKEKSMREGMQIADVLVETFYNSRSSEDILKVALEIGRHIASFPDRKAHDDAGKILITKLLARDGSENIGWIVIAAISDTGSNYRYEYFNMIDQYLKTPQFSPVDEWTNLAIEAAFRSK